MTAATPTTRIGARPRDYVAVRGAGAEAFLQAMVSNDVEKLAVGDSCEALLLTAKARIIAPLVVLRRAVEDFLLLTEPGAGERVRTTLARMRFAAKCEVEPEEHTSTIVFSTGEGIQTTDYGEPAVELLDAPQEPTLSADDLELLRIKAGTPRLGREIDDRVLPAEAGLEARAIDFAKGCYPGQEPIARQHYRGRVNRSLRLFAFEGAAVPAYDAELLYEGKVVGRVTSAARDGGEIVGLAYVRVDVPREAVLELEGRAARPLDFASPRP